MRKTLTILLSCTMILSSASVFVCAEDNLKSSEPVSIDSQQAILESNDNVEEQISLQSDEKFDIANAKTEISGFYFEYDGLEHKPSVSLYYLDDSQARVDIPSTEYDIVYPTDVSSPGLKTITITAKSSSEAYTGETSVGYCIAYKSIANITRSKIEMYSVKLSWSETSGASGYRIYRIKDDSETLLYTVSGKKNTSKTIQKLYSASDYDFVVRAYDSTGFEYAQSAIKHVATKPGKVKATGFTTLFDEGMPYLRGKWSSRAADSYQVEISRSSKFKKSTKITVSGSSTRYRFKTKVVQGRKYYFRVRAINKNGDATSYGAWSDTRYTKGKTGTFVTKNGVIYYYKYGKKLKGQQTINGKPYYFSTSSGALLGTSRRMWKHVDGATSKTKYLVCNSTAQRYTCVYHKVNGKWRVCKVIRISCGADGTRTRKGTFEVPKKRSKLNHFGNENGYTVWYATRIYGEEYFHSVKYRVGSKTRILDGRLGQYVSHGCIRMSMENAKWIYKNIKSGTKVITYW